MSPDATGTMHYADRVTLGVGPGVDVVIETNVEHGVLAPIVERVVDLGGAFLVMGWSSWGGGEQTNTAFIVEGARCGGLRFVDRLDLTAARGASALLIDPVSGAVGIPPPSNDNGQGQASLTVGDTLVELSAPVGMTSRRAAEWYAPMTLSSGPAAQTRALWFGVGETGFESW